MPVPQPPIPPPARHWWSGTIGIREDVEPGTSSALFLMSGDAVLDKIKEAFSGTFVGGRPQLIHTNLSNDQEAALGQVFGE